MHATATNYAESTLEPPKGGQLSWLLDTSIIISAAAAIFVTVIPAGLWTHRGHVLTPPSAFVSGRNPDAAEATAGPTGAPLLWRVQENGATLYVFGAIQSHHGDLNWMDPRLFQAFDTSGEVWLARPVALPKAGDLTADRGPAVLLSQRASVLGKPVKTFGAASTGFDEDITMNTAWRLGDERAMMARAGFDGRLGQGQGADAASLAKALQPGRSIFVVADVSRLIGPSGLIAQLRQAGHKVDRLDP